MKIARVVTVPEAFIHIKFFLQYAKMQKSEIVLISSAGNFEKIIYQELGIKITHVEIERDISIYKDIKAVISLYKIFRENKFDIIHSSTPKAGLLTALAGAFVPASIRVHTFTGQRWANMSGVMRCLLKKLDWLVVKLNTACYADSNSQIMYLENEKVVREKEILCLGNGSYGGVDCDKFRPENYVNAREEILKKLCIEHDCTLVLFAGRLRYDKGLEELILAFKQANIIDDKIKLLILGTDELSISPMSAEVEREMNSNHNIYKLGYTLNPELYYSAVDFLCLPSHREGFPTVVIEAAACGTPAIATRIPGVVDTIIDGKTGILIGMKNIKELRDAILLLAKRKDLKTEMGKHARERALKDFDAKNIAEIQYSEYIRILKNRRKVKKR